MTAQENDLEKKYADIIDAINAETRKELRKIGHRKNVLPSKIILPQAYITRLLEYPLFKRVFARKVFWRYIINLRTDEPMGWFPIETYPNWAGIPIEIGPELKVELREVPRRKRGKKVGS
jgi:hypothetical protein